ncbi:hypothetical protein F5X68DRAFT_162092 [Plectosphaerella plurivora]|uniref:Septin-type G domain-containing protein n=1 Tax=Plectosphaerella plurivora TaxID=936078 RepID=A0A9P9A669_9PEZI|nr:hypothetical protein F5X68DRAFT_162092 [Plectosphaerella plurivora]
MRSRPAITGHGPSMPPGLVAGGASEPTASPSTSSQMTFILANEASTESFCHTPSTSTPPGGSGPGPHWKREDIANQGTASGGGTHSRHQTLESGKPSPSGLFPSMPSPSQSPLRAGLGPPSVLSNPSSQRDSLAASLSEGRGSFISSMLDEPWNDCTLSLMGSDQDLADESQFIMPTIPVSNQTTFTDEGKSLGRLKVLVAGQPGLGKTSLIEAIIRSCQDIIHVKPTTTASCGDGRDEMGSFAAKCRSRFPTISETYASTRPLPAWRRSSDGQRGLVRSTGDLTFDMNLCFADLEGGLSQQVPDYIESHLHRTAFDDLSDAELLTIVGDGGGLLVDAILYLAPKTGLTTSELDVLSRMSANTSIIPILAQADTLSSEEVLGGQTLITRQLREAGVAVFAFGSSASDDSPPIIYAVSSKASHDSTTVTSPSSVLGLPSLVAHFLSAEGGEQLRRAAASKLVQWRRSTHRRGSQSQSHGQLIHVERLGPMYTHRTGRGEPRGSRQWPRLHVVNWAVDLQHCLMKEQVTYHQQSLARQRANWMAQLPDGGMESNVATSMLGPRRGLRGSCQVEAQGSSHRQDPLGLLELGMPRGKWYSIEFTGSLVVASSFLAWILY